MSEYSREISPQLRELLEAAPDAMVIADQSGRILLLNSQVEKLFGYERGELIGRPVELLMPGRYRPGHVGHRHAYFSDPRARSMGGLGSELMAARKDGSEFPAEISLSPMRTDQGTVAIASIRDVTARRRVEARFRTVLDAAPDPIIITNGEGRIVILNAATERMFGYGRLELLGHPAIDVLPGYPSRAFQPDPSRRGPAHREHAAIELVGRRHDGRTFNAEITLSPLETEEGPMTIAAVRDLTERRRAEEERARFREAQEAIRIRDEFLSIASHELKTPLTAMLMHIQSLLRVLEPGRSDPQRLQSKVGTIQRMAHRLNDLIGELLDVSRITAGRLNLQRELVDLTRMVREVVARFDEAAARAGCEIRVHAPRPVAGYWDPNRLDQIVTNLLSNAIKYGAGEPVDIEVGSNEGMAWFKVRDRGIGIAPEHQSRLFQRFERVVSNRNYGGFGLGLWIVRQLVEAHGGAVRLESALGVGSEFLVELPTHAYAESPSHGAH
jgi:PAS domain S-box-containing protein